MATPLSSPLWGAPGNLPQEGGAAVSPPPTTCRVRVRSNILRCTMCLSQKQNNSEFLKHTGLENNGAQFPLIFHLTLAVVYNKREYLIYLLTLLGKTINGKGCINLPGNSFKQGPSAETVNNLLQETSHRSTTQACSFLLLYKSSSKQSKFSPESFLLFR